MKKINRIILVVVLLLAMSTTVFGAEYAGVDGLDNVQPADTLTVDKDVLEVIYTAKWEKLSAEGTVLSTGKMNSSKNNTQSPKTGDSSDFGIYGIIALIALGLFVALGVYGYKKNKKIISFMVLLFAFTLATPFLTNSKAFASPQVTSPVKPVEWPTVGLSYPQHLNYHVTFKDGTEESVASMPMDVSSCTDEVFTTSSNVPERSGYKFVGWKITVLERHETSYTLHFDGKTLAGDVVEDIMPERTVSGAKEGQILNLNDAFRSEQYGIANKDVGTFEYFKDQWPVTDDPVNTAVAGIPKWINFTDSQHSYGFGFMNNIDTIVLSANPEENVIRIMYVQPPK